MKDTPCSQKSATVKIKLTKDDPRHPSELKNKRKASLTVVLCILEAPTLVRGTLDCIWYLRSPPGSNQ